MKQIYYSLIKGISYLSSDFIKYYFGMMYTTLVVTVFQNVTLISTWN